MKHVLLTVNKLTANSSVAFRFRATAKNDGTVTNVVMSDGRQPWSDFLNDMGWEAAQAHNWSTTAPNKLSDL